jgi:hypothetical protein
LAGFLDKPHLTPAAHQIIQSANTKLGVAKLAAGVND